MGPTPPSRWPALTLRRGLWLLAPLVLVLTLAAFERQSAPQNSEVVPRIEPAMLNGPGYGARDHADAFARSNGQLAMAREKYAAAPGEWLRAETLAAAHDARFRLSHDYAELAKAVALIDEATAAAPEGSGPLLRRAGLMMTAHRIDEAGKSLAVFDHMAVAPPASDRAEALAIRGDIAFYRGDWREAERQYGRSELLAGDKAQSWRRAILAKARGEYDRAIALFAATLHPGSTPSARAAVALRIGEIESARGEIGRAGEYYRAADRLFPGWWLADAHIAEADAMAGRNARAMTRMAHAAEQGDAPEAMDALAMLYRAAGDRAKSDRWADRAGRIWAQRVRLAPQAAYAHAAEHELAFGSPMIAVDLARRNLDNRPFPESRLLYANTLIATGQIAEAQRQLALAEQGGWRSAPLYAAMAQAAALAGDGKASEAARAKAMAINPRIFDGATALAWFGHG